MQLNIMSVTILVTKNFKFIQALLEDLSYVLQSQENRFRMLCNCIFLILILGFETEFAFLFNLCMCTASFRCISDAIFSQLLTKF